MREAKVAIPLFGAHGMVKLRYLGGLSTRWKGPITGTRYPFSVKNPLRFVDRDDADCMLEQKQSSGSQYFEVADGNANQGTQARPVQRR